MHPMRSCVFLITLCLIIAAGCATPLARGGGSLSASNDRWEMKLVKMTAGPDQYITAAGVWRPRDGRRYVWATVKLRNTLKTPQVFRLDRIWIHHGDKRKKPCIIDMNTFISLRADHAPKLCPGETVTRRLGYMMSRGETPDRVTYEDREIVVAGPKGR
jgi:hypothetical protein